jgi:prolyl-tRNA editing enzyme YbaK/EbsC (Cys-tRNA(Pro) deacylase)
VAGSVERFTLALTEHGLADRVVHLTESTRTAEMAANALGTAVGAIVKSLVVLADARPIVALVSGDRRADLARLANLANAINVEMARGARVKEITGFAIGGVPPLLTDEAGEPLATIFDRDLLRFDEVWAAAGSPYAVFPIAPAHLAELSRATVADFTSA